LFMELNVPDKDSFIQSQALVHKRTHSTSTQENTFYIRRS